MDNQFQSLDQKQAESINGGSLIGALIFGYIIGFYLGGILFGE